MDPELEMKNERPSGQELNNSCSVVSVRWADNLEDICSMLEFSELTVTYK